MPSLSVPYWVSNRAPDNRRRVLLVLGAASPSIALKAFALAFPEETAAYAYFTIDGVETYVAHFRELDE